MKVWPTNFNGLFPQIEVYALKTQTIPPYSETNTIFIGETDFFVIDPGTVEEDLLLKLSAHIEKRQNKGHRCLGILLTHHHLDHSGGARFLKSEWGLPILASKDAPKKADGVLFDQQELLAGVNCVIRVIETPGHCPGHVSFFHVPSGVLCAGDMICDNGTILIDPSEGHLPTYLNSLKCLIEMPISWVVPAHGKPIPKGQRFLQKALSHRYGRLWQIIKELEKKEQSSKELTEALYSEIAPELLGFAERSVLSSLNCLSEMGLIIKRKGDYFPADKPEIMETLPAYEKLKEESQKLQDLLGNA